MCMLGIGVCWAIYVRARCMLGLCVCLGLVYAGLGVCSGYVYAWDRCMLGIGIYSDYICSG